MLTRRLSVLNRQEYHLKDQGNIRQKELPLLLDLNNK